jgi:hypothetical protein
MNQGTRWVHLMQKNRHQKSHAWAPLSHEDWLEIDIQELILNIYVHKRFEYKAPYFFSKGFLMILLSAILN